MGNTKKARWQGSPETPKYKQVRTNPQPQSLQGISICVGGRRGKQQQAIWWDTLRKEPQKYQLVFLERKACWIKLRTTIKLEEVSLLPVAGECKGRKVKSKGIRQEGSTHSPNWPPWISFQDRAAQWGGKKEKLPEWNHNWAIQRCWRQREDKI